jgi:hypothetical protein
MKTNRYNTQSYLEKVKLIHGDKYDYSKLKYINSKTKVTIICKKHGEFTQFPCYHINGCGCNACGIDLKTGSLDKFLSRSIEIHKDLYDYSKSNYITNNTKIEIICKIHGSFWQMPILHYKGNGCPECAKLTRAKHFVLSKEEFVYRANKIHNNFYNYDKFDYINCKINSIIICPKHSEYSSSSGNHLAGKGCKLCAHENHGGHYGSIAKRNPDLMVYLYHLELENKNGFIFYKIGLAKDVNKRIEKFNRLKVKILETQYGKIKDLYPLEKKFHEIIKEFNIQYMPPELRENYSGGYTECYKW